jgi:ribulose-5-phosphate 4-epimerase/fuculose-1-phosphate aldolase
MKKISSLPDKIDQLLELSYAVSSQAICGEGNVSMRGDDSFYIKASGTDLATLEWEDTVHCDLDGNAKKGEDKKPSMEVGFHAWFYRTFPEINYVCHTHPTNTVKILCSGRTISFAHDRLFPDQVVRNGAVSCLVPYATPGIPLMEVIEENVNAFIEREKFFPKLILLKNHGIITVSASAKDCATSALMCEKSAEIFIGAKLLDMMSFLPPEKVAEVNADPNEKYRRDLIK